MKNSNDTIGNQPATFRFVAQCLNQLFHRVPPNFSIGFSTNIQISNFMKICTVGVDSFHEDGKQTYNEANSRFSQFAKGPKNAKIQQLLTNLNYSKNMTAL